MSAVRIVNAGYNAVRWLTMIWWDHLVHRHSTSGAL